MSIYKAQAEITLQDKASSAFTQMANKMRRAATSLRTGVANAFSSMRSKINNAISGMMRSVMRFLPLLTTAGLAYGFITATKEAANFSEQIAKVSTMLSGPALSHLGKFSDALKKMSTEFGRSTKDLSDGLYNTLSAGILASDALEHLTTVTKAAVGGFAPLADVARAVSAIMQGFKKDAVSALKATDVLAAIVDKGLTTLSEIAPVIGMVTGQAASLGISLDNLGGAVAHVTKLGTGASTTITSIRAVMTGLSNATGEYGDTIKILRTALQARGFVGFAEVLRDMKLTTDELAALFPNVRAKAALLAMMNDVNGLKSSIDAVTNSTGLTQTKFEQMASSAAFKFAKMRQEIVGLQRTVGEALLPGILEAVKSISTIIKTDIIQSGLKVMGQFVGQFLKDIIELIAGVVALADKTRNLGKFIQSESDDIYKFILSKVADLTATLLGILRPFLNVMLHLILGALAKIFSVIPVAAETIAGWTNDLIQGAIDHWSARALELRHGVVKGSDALLKILEKKIKDSTDRVVKTAKQAASDLPAWSRKLSTTPSPQPPTRGGARRYGAETPRDRLRNLLSGGGVEEMAVGAIPSPQMLGGFGIPYGGRLMKYIEMYGRDEGIKKYNEKIAREKRMVPGRAGFISDITPAARQRRRRAAAQQAMIRQRPMEFAQRVTGQMGELERHLTTAIIGGDTRRVKAIQERMKQLGKMREVVSPGLKSQLDHLKKIEKALVKGNKEVPGKIAKKILELQAALGIETPEEKKTREKEEADKEKADELKERAEEALRQQDLADKITKPIVDAVAKNYASATASVSVNCQGNCSVEKQEITTPGQIYTPVVNEEPTGSPIYSGGYPGHPV